MKWIKKILKLYDRDELIDYAFFVHRYYLINKHLSTGNGLIRLWERECLNNKQQLPFPKLKDF